ncbi:MAG: PAS domain S-box protein [Bacteroidetes bacterium]|nr:PAS domain S-box protein [Bacteroidota bacterium]
MEATFKIEGIDSGGVYLVDKHTGELSLKAHKGLSPQFVEKANQYKADSPQAIQILSGIPAYQHTSDVNSPSIIILQNEKLRAFSVVPVKHENEVIAALNLASHSLDEFQQNTRNAIEAIATQIGGVIARIYAEEKLRESQINLQSLFDTLTDFLFILDSDGQILHFNPMVEECLGYTQKDLTKMTVLEMHPPERREEAAKIVADMLAGRDTNCPIPLMKKDGTFIPVETKVIQGKWGGENVLFGISRDITQRQHAENLIKSSLKEKESLLKEIHHRVKNNLQVISSLLSLHADKANNPSVLESFAEADSRVRSMALVHEILYQSDNFDKIEFQTFLLLKGDAITV